MRPIDPLENLRLESERLSLRPLAPEDTEAIFREFTPGVTTYTYPKAPDTIDETRQFVSHAMQQNQSGTDLHLTILRKNTSDFLGLCGITEVMSDHPHLGIWLKQAAQGFGFGREAVSLLKRWADDHLEYEYLVYPVDRRNLPSRRIVEGLGGKMQQEYPQMNLSGNLLEVLEYWIYR